MLPELQEQIDLKEKEFINYKNLITKYSSLYEKCLSYVKKGYVLISDNYTGININYHLEEDESFEKEVNFYIEEIEEKLNISNPSIKDYTDGQWVHYKYVTSDHLYIHIFFHYEKSKYCKLVPTGETKPVYKRVCV